MLEGILPIIEQKNDELIRVVHWVPKPPPSGFSHLPALDLTLHWFEVVLHAIRSNRDSVYQASFDESTPIPI